jgi:NADP oxidoreductase coenzyme F420-dependent
MRIAVIGKGNIGGSLGTKWRAAGHDVVYGARDGSGEGPGGAPVRGIGDALKDVDVVVLAVPGQVVADVVTGHGAALAGKTVIDAVNRIGAPEFDSRAIIADAAPQARYVRAFNSLGWENFADPMRTRTPGPPPRSSSGRSAWSRPSSATPTPPPPSTACSRCGSRWSSRTAATAGSRCGWSRTVSHRTRT